MVQEKQKRAPFDSVQQISSKNNTIKPQSKQRQKLKIDNIHQSIRSSSQGDKDSMASPTSARKRSIEYDKMRKRVLHHGEVDISDLGSRVINTSKKTLETFMFLNQPS